MRRIATGLALSVITATMAMAAGGKVSVPHRYDGTWGIEAVTGDGPCPKSARYDVTIRQGRASIFGVDDVSVEGDVTPNGEVRGTIVANSVRLPVNGTLMRDGSGTGTWRTGDDAPVGCSGRWTARRSG